MDPLLVAGQLGERVDLLLLDRSASRSTPTSSTWAEPLQTGDDDRPDARTWVAPTPSPLGRFAHLLYVALSGCASAPVLATGHRAPVLVAAESSTAVGRPPTRRSRFPAEWECPEGMATGLAAGHDGSPGRAREAAVRAPDTTGGGRDGGRQYQWRGRSVISKVVALLDAFTPTAPELSLNELAALTGLPVSTTYRLASELVAWGGLERVEGGGYRIGLRLWEIGSLAPRGETLREVALPFMNDLYEATHENVHLAVLDGTEALYVEKLSAARDAGATRRGGRLPLHATAVGKVLLAYGPDSLFREMSPTGWPATPRTPSSPGAPSADAGRDPPHRDRLRTRGADCRHPVGGLGGPGRRRRPDRGAVGHPAIRPGRSAAARPGGTHRRDLGLPGHAATRVAHPGPRGADRGGDVRWSGRPTRRGPTPPRRT